MAAEAIEDQYQAMVDREWEAVAPAIFHRLVTVTIPLIDRIEGDKALIAADRVSEADERVDPERRHSRLRESEEAFFKRVYGEILRLTHGDPRGVVLLFDIDQTLASRKHITGDYEGSLVRPAAPFLLDLLYKQGYVLSILTSRSVGDIMTGLMRKDDLAEIEPYISRQYVVGVEDQDLSDLGVDAEAAFSFEDFMHFRPLLKQAFNTGEAMIDEDAFRFYRDHKDKGFPVKDIIKLGKLADFHKHDPTSLFIVIDDRDYADMLSKEPEAKVKGIFLREHERAHY